MNTSTTYRDELMLFIGGGRNSNYRKIKNNTYAVITKDAFGNNVVGIQYHNTVIFGIRDDGHYFFNNGGWFTTTTKARINDAIQHCGMADSIIQKKKKWYLNNMIVDFGYYLFDTLNRPTQSLRLNCWAFPIKF